MKNQTRGFMLATSALALTLTAVSAQNLFVVNYGNGKVSEFDSSGTLITGSFASGLTGPDGLAFDRSGNLFTSGISAAPRFRSLVPAGP